MNERGLTPDSVRQQHAALVSTSETFRPEGISKQVAIDYLNTDEGTTYWLRVAAGFDAETPIEEITKHALNALRSGRELPRMETIGTDEVLVKFVAEGFDPSEFSPYWARESGGNAAVEAGKNISQFYGLPIGSEAPRYGMYRMTARVPTRVSVGRRRNEI